MKVSVFEYVRIDWRYILRWLELTGSNRSYGVSVR
jgi:hypothetical protein